MIKNQKASTEPRRTTEFFQRKNFGQKLNVTIAQRFKLLSARYFDDKHFALILLNNQQNMPLDVGRPKQRPILNGYVGENSMLALV